MYGKKRIVISKKGQISLKGGKSVFRLGGVCDNQHGKLASFLKPEYKFERRLTDENSIVLNLPTLEEIRKEINKIYAKELGITE